MPLKKNNKKKRRKQKITKRKRRKSKGNKKKKRKNTRKLKLKGGGLFDDLKDFVGMKKEPVTDKTEKGNCPTTGDKINNLFGRFRKGANDVAGAAKKAGDQAIGEVKGIAKDAKDKATAVAGNATTAVVGDKNEKPKIDEKCKCCGKVWTGEDDKLAKEKEKQEKEEKLNEEKKKEDKKDPKMQEVEINADDNADDKADDKEAGDKDKSGDKDKDTMKLNTGTLELDSLENDTMELNTIDDAELGI